MKYEKKHYELIWEGTELNLPPSIVQSIWEEDFLDFPTTYSALNKKMYDCRMWPGTFEEFIEYYLNPRKPRWTDEQTEWVVKNMPHNNKQGDHEKIPIKFKEKFKFIRPIESLENKRRQKLGIQKIKNTKLLDTSDLHPTLRIKPGTDLTQGTKVRFPIICENGHEFTMLKPNFPYRCTICHPNSIGIDFNNYTTIALVYAVWVDELKGIKPGFTRIKEGQTPEEAIKERFEQHYIPYDYDILAYDISVEAIAGRHERYILDNTEEWQYWDQNQGWGGWTEMRTKEAFCDILCEYETVLNIVFKIKV